MSRAVAVAPGRSSLPPDQPAIARLLPDGRCAWPDRPNWCLKDTCDVSSRRLDAPVLSKITSR
jgi:hypothetical protein